MRRNCMEGINDNIIIDNNINNNKNKNNKDFYLSALFKELEGTWQNNTNLQHWVANNKHSGKAKYTINQYKRQRETWVVIDV